MTSHPAPRAFSDARHEPREAVQFRASAYVAGGTVELLVVNVSAGGMMARTDDDMVRADDPITVRLPGCGTVMGEVRWALGGRIGVEFTEAIPLARYMDLLAHALVQPQHAVHLGRKPLIVGRDQRG